MSAVGPDDAATPLAPSARTALRWARAASVSRNRLVLPSPNPGISVAAVLSDAIVDSVDLLAGLLFGRPADSPVRRLLDRLDIHPARVFGEHLAIDTMAGSFQFIPADEVPPMSSDARVVVDGAASGGPFDAEGLFGADALFVSLVRLPSVDGSQRLAAAMRDAGYEYGALTVAVETFMRFATPGPADAGAGWKEALQSLPAGTPTVRLPRFSHDNAGGGSPADVRPVDLVDIGPEVNAFAHLLASTTVNPPLAIGLFGEWGAGKSFFMRSIRDRIVDIVKLPEVRTQPQTATVFYKKIIQIEFNAWQYVGGNLWASLIDHIFAELKGREINRVHGARKKIEAELESVKQTREALEARQQAAQNDVVNRTEKLRTAEEHRDTVLNALRKAQTANPLATAQINQCVRNAVVAAVTNAGITNVGESAADLIVALDTARLTLLRAPSVLAPLRAGGKVRWRYTLALMGVLLLVPLIGFLQAWFGWSTLATVSGQVGTVLAGVAAVVRRSNDNAVELLKKVEAARRELDAQVDAERKRLDDQVESEQRQLLAAEHELTRAKARVASAESTTAELEYRLNAITPTSVLNEIIGERADSDDYRRHLGLPAVIRRDLEELSEVIREQNRLLLQQDTGDADVDKRINRIVLYIDDLDRCPIDKVIEVLQAVHLLLAFELFIVVVAVDTRWLISALKAHYSQLLRQTGASPADDRAEALNYVEKIFQIPFWVEPLGALTRRNVVRGLLATAIVPEPTGGSEHAMGEQHALPEGLDGLGTWLERPVMSTPQIAAEALAIVSRELAFMEEVSPILGSTPRSLKRFVNLYLLVKAIAVTEAGGVEFINRDDEFAPYRIVIFLLALSTSHPTHAGCLFATINEPPHGWTLSKGVGEIAEAMEWMTGPRLGWGNLQADVLRPWAEHVRRFSFYRS
jgi:hypothetical protein